MIPGLAIFTKRAEPLATWMTGLEVAFFKVGSFHVVRVLDCGDRGWGRWPRHFSFRKVHGRTSRIYARPNMKH